MDQNIIQNGSKYQKIDQNSYKMDQNIRQNGSKYHTNGSKFIQIDQNSYKIIFYLSKSLVLANPLCYNFLILI